MANWLSAISANFNTKADWSTHRIPVYNGTHKDDAILTVAGSAYTVSVTTNEDVRSLQLASNATLSATGAGSFLVNAGIVNAGAIKIGDGYTFMTLGASLANTGRIALAANAANSFLDVEANLSVSGAGKIVMSDSAFNGIVAQNLFGNGTVTFTNVGNTISGGGVIGDGGLASTGALAVDNQTGGVINASAKLNSLRLSTPGVDFVNGGLIEATGAAGLDIAATTVNGAGGGAILAANGSMVRLEAAVIAGGTLQTAGTGAFVASGGSALDGTASTVHNQGLLKVIDGDTLQVQGALDNSGTISLAGAAIGEQMLVQSGGLTLSGGGRIDLGDFYGDSITGATPNAVLNNVANLITGDGSLGLGQMGLVNGTNAIIHEDGNSGLFIDTGGSAVINAGLIEASNVGGIMIEDSLVNSGYVEAAGAGNVQIFGAIRNTGTLQAFGGTLTAYQGVTGAGAATIDGGGLDFLGAFNEAVTFTGTSGVLQLAQSQGYKAAISGFSKTGGTSLDLGDIGFVSAKEATFAGTATSGVLTVSDGTHTALIKLRGDYRSQTFVAADDGNGGVSITAVSGLARSPGAPAPTTQGFAAAMAGFGAPVAGAVAGEALSAHDGPPALCAPRSFA